MDDQRKNQESRPQTSSDPLRRGESMGQNPTSPTTGPATGSTAGGYMGTGMPRDPITTPREPAQPEMQEHMKTGGEKSTTSEVVDQAKTTASKTASNVKGMLRDRLDTGYHKAGERLNSTVGDMRKVADSLDQQGQPGASKLVNSATKQAERLTSYMESKSAEELLDDASTYARKHMWAVVAGGAVLGLIAARFLKASSVEPPEQQASQPMTGYVRAA